MMPFLYNAWYTLGWSDEIADDAILARTVLNVPIAAWRDPASRRLVALEDRCPHRFAPLSRGTLVDGNIQCGYHGLTFNTAGPMYPQRVCKVRASSCRCSQFSNLRAARHHLGLRWVMPRVRMNRLYLKFRITMIRHSAT